MKGILVPDIRGARCTLIIYPQPQPWEQGGRAKMVARFFIPDPGLPGSGSLTHHQSQIRVRVSVSLPQEMVKIQGICDYIIFFTTQKYFFSHNHLMSKIHSASISFVTCILIYKIIRIQTQVQLVPDPPGILKMIYFQQKCLALVKKMCNYF